MYILRTLAVVILAIVGCLLLVSSYPLAGAPILFQVRTSKVHSIIPSPDGRLLALVSYDHQSTSLWDVSSQKMRVVLPTESWQVAFSHDGKRLAACAPEDKVRIWDVETGQELPALYMRSEPGDCSKMWGMRLAFSPDGKMIAYAGASSNTIQLWDIDIAKVRTTMPGHGDAIHSLAFNADSSMLASGSYDKTNRVWDVKSGKEILTLNENSWTWVSATPRHNCFAFSPDGKNLASCADDHIRLWDLATGKQRNSLDARPWNYGEYTADSVAFSGDGKYLVTVVGFTIILWDAATGECIDASEHGFRTCPEPRHLGPQEGKPWPEYAFFCPDGRVLALGADSFEYTDTVMMWEVTRVSRGIR